MGALGGDAMMLYQLGAKRLETDHIRRVWSMSGRSGDVVQYDGMFPDEDVRRPNERLGSANVFSSYFMHDAGIECHADD